MDKFSQAATTLLGMTKAELRPALEAASGVSHDDDVEMAYESFMGILREVSTGNHDTINDGL